MSGSGPDQLEKPRSPQRLANGDVFMGDADGDRFFVVDRATKQIIWQFGHTDQPGAGWTACRTPPTDSVWPTAARSSRTRATERVLRVPADGGAPTVYDMGVLGRPASATSTDVAEPRGATIGR